MKKAGVITAMSLAAMGFSGATAAALPSGSADLPGLPGVTQPGPPAPPDGKKVGDPCTPGGGVPGHYEWVHLDEDSAAHYGTEWMFVCQAN
ncbi:hypothetical protein IU448_08165 [Nocardia flavorosea]|uniref:hypothetical protein n=1 Tax=Nocardia flavorosea TaxID=53429 RepID=UPI001895DFD1|nr:hypothetical protein [Nocardia flavorosea]MBF6348994.1 hypothetical protein [Nocardia flavorosea]